MLNTFSQSLIIWEPTIEMWAQEMNEGPGTNWGTGELNSSPTLEIILQLLSVADVLSQLRRWIVPNPWNGSSESYVNDTCPVGCWSEKAAATVSRQGSALILKNG